MKKLDKKIMLQHAMKVNMGSVKLIDGSKIVFDGDDFGLKTIGKTVYLQDGSNDWFILAAGEYMTAENQPFTIDESGNLKSIGKNQNKSVAPNQSIKQLQNKTKMSIEKKQSLLDSEIAVAYAKSKQNGDNGESLESFSKKYAPTKLNDVLGMFDQLEKVRAHNTTKDNGGMTFNAKPATSNLNEKEKADYIAEANALGIKTYATPAEKIIAAKVAEGLSLYVNLSRDEEQKIKDRIIANAKIEFEKEKQIATNLKNKLPKDMTIIERIIAERGW